MYLHVKPVPLYWSFDIIYDEFSKFGTIKEIRNRIEEKFKFFETWIIFDKAEDALKALNEFSHETVSVKGSLVEDFPLYLDVFRPTVEPETPQEYHETNRFPEPPSWIILTTKNQHGNLFKIKKFINQKLGHLKRPDVTRYGRNSFLIHTKSSGQAAMLLNSKLDPEGLIKDVKPHFNFSYARGVVFNEDIYELTDEEILDMCPDVVWKIFKVPRSSMIIFTFINSNLPSELILENEMIRVRPYRPRVLQCFKCYGFGHASRICVKDKICEHCSQPEHEECSSPKVCVNCKGGHSARDKECKVYKNEQEALLKSIAEHISVGHAKKLLAKSTYSDIVKVPKSLSVHSANNVLPATHTVTNRTRSLEVSTNGASQASPTETSRASFVGANKTTSDGASRSSTSGTTQAPTIVTPQTTSDGDPKNASSEMSQIPSGTSQSSSALEAQPDTRSRVDSGGRLGSLNNLDEISLPGSLPDIEGSPETFQSSPIVTVHRLNNGTEVEALSVRQKRPYTATSPQSSSAGSGQGKSDDKANTQPNQVQSRNKQLKLERNGKSRKKNEIERNRVSLSRPSNIKSEEPNKKVPKTK